MAPVATSYTSNNGNGIEGSSSFTPPPIVEIGERRSSAAGDGISAKEYAASSWKAQEAPLVIDNGSSELRAGFASSDTSSGPAFAFDNVISKFKDRKRGASYLLAGSDCYLDASSRSSTRSAFDTDVVTNFDVMENVLDHTFVKLGIDGSTVPHPILMTETLCNPTHSRTLMSELLFENYGVPSVCYGLDSLFSAYQNDVRDGLVVSSGKMSTTVVPLLDGRGLIDFSKRLNWGGSLATEHLLRLVQLKYPSFPTRVTAPQSAWMLENMCYVHSGEDSYEELVGSLAGPSALAREDRVVQFPYTVEAKEEKTAEELEAIAERKREAGRRLQEQAQRTRLEKMMQKENDLQYYAQLKEWKTKERKAEYLKRLESDGFKSEQDLENTIKKIEVALKKGRAKQLGEEGGAEEVEAVEEPTFPLVDLPDHELDEEQLKEKRKQRLMKAGYEARKRAKAEKAEEERLKQEELRRDEEERINDPRTWAEKKRRLYEESISRIREKKRLKAMLSDRKSLAAQQRMKNITSLASDQPTGSRKRRKGGDEDTFGADDDDWAIYREIRGEEDSEEEEDEATAMAALEKRLLEHDATFTEADTWEAQQSRKNKLTMTFLRGEHPAWDPEDVGQQHQIHLNIERTRVPEVLWQPSKAGVDQAGIDELCALILRNFELEPRRKLATNIFVTGQHTQYPKFDARLRSSIQSTQPVDLNVRVLRAKDVRFDAWRGMAKWATKEHEAFQKVSISKQEWMERGPDWFKDHQFAAAIQP